MRPDGMERWGMAAILKEAARLLRHHFRRFLPFFLAFLLPLCFVWPFLYVFLPPSRPTLPSFAYNPAPGRSQREHTYGPPSRGISITYYIGVQVVQALGMLYAAASTYIVAYIYSNEDVESNDESITKRVFKLLPHALFRMYVTQLWTSLVIILPGIACLFLSIVIVVLVFIAGFIGAKVFFYMVSAVMLFFYIVAFGWGFSFGVVFLLVWYIAVLEPEKYGRAALKQTTKYVKVRAGIIFGGLVLNSLSGLVYAPLQPVIGNAGVPVWVKIAVAVLVSVLSLVVTAYIVLVAVVTYFVCKSSFEAGLPEFQRGSNISIVENPYEPIEHGRIYL